MITKICRKISIYRSLIVDGERIFSKIYYRFIYFLRKF